MFAAGERLKFALDLERNLSRLMSEKRDAALPAQLRECRDSVDRFSQDYAAAVGAWRRAVVKDAAQMKGDGDIGRCWSSWKVYLDCQAISPHPSSVLRRRFAAAVNARRSSSSRPSASRAWGPKGSESRWRMLPRHVREIGMRQNNRRSDVRSLQDWQK